MRQLMTAGAMALALTAGAAITQPAAAQILASDLPPLAAPPRGTLSITSTEKSVGPDGASSETTTTTYRNSDGVEQDSASRTTTTTTYPPAPASAVETTRRSSTTTVTQ